MFAIKIGAYASGEHSGLPHKAGSWLYPQKLARLENLAGKHERVCNLRANDWDRTGEYPRLVDRDFYQKISLEIVVHE
jgi:hypothetical protein